MSKQDYSGYILPAGIVIAGYLLLKHFDLLGDSANTANNNSTNAATTAGNAQAIAAEKANGGFAILTTSQAANIANAIYMAGVSDPVDEYTIQNQIIQADTTLDVLNIASAFGTKQAASSSFSLCATIGLNCQSYNLGGFLRAVLSQSTINTINNYFADQGINYTI
jgi:hypothetical protein